MLEMVCRKETLLHCGGKVNWCSHYGEQYCLVANLSPTLMRLHGLWPPRLLLKQVRAAGWAEKKLSQEAVTAPASDQPTGSSEAGRVILRYPSF